jgi:Rrf2 family protein
MSLISTKGIYGLSAILILYREKNGQLLSIKNIAQRAKIPQNYLEQILIVLKKNNIIQSTRGANGGYRIIKNSKDITVYSILHSLECCIEYENKNQTLLDPFLDDFHKKVQNFLYLTICELEKFLLNNSNYQMYYI